MNKERWRQIEAVFAEAVELPDAESRAFLERVCAGDPELRREVELLLESDRRAREPEGSPVGQAIGHAAAAFAVQMQRDFSASQIGRRIGPYEIVREIGRGGMGSVYQAVRIDDQYIRSVAIKFIAHGMDTEDALARFRTERQILATLQHPNIAGLLDGGTTTDGRPYIVMEYIEGEPLLEFCQKRNLNIERRIELFCDLCSAVHHAHQMLVIHRDIKPANVLVTDQGVPKLLDFGIAKLMAPELVHGGSQTTMTVMRRMTPQYASPEQIRGEALTTATDIYSLGVLLYELLTQSSPYRITGHTSQEVERIVCDSEPMRLSTAAHSDSRLRRQLSGDLENIVAMALRKEPHRRYASVQQFAVDLERYIAGMPVSAREDTMFYLATKLVRRNLLASAAFGLLALSIGAGWYATYREAKRTEARFEELRKLANAVLFDFHKSIEHLPGSTPARELLVRTGMEYLNRLSVDASTDLSLQWELSQAYEQVGDVQGDPSGPNLGKFREALASYNKALQLAEPLSNKNRDYGTLSCIAWLHYKCGDIELRTASVDTAVESYMRGLRVSERIGAELHDARADGLLLNGYMRVATAKTRMSAAKEALPYAQMAVEAADRAAEAAGQRGTADMARTRLLVGSLLWIRGDLHGAWDRYQEAVAWLEQLVEKEPDARAPAELLEEAYRRSGDLQGNPSYFHFGDMEKAKFYHRKALRIAEHLATRDPKDATARAQLSIALRRMGAVQRAAEPLQAVELYREALEHLKTLLDRAPSDLNYQRDYANTQLGLAAALKNAGRSKLALDAALTAMGSQKKILEQHPERSVVREDLFDSTTTLADIRLALRDYAGAFSTYQDALKQAEALRQDDRENLYAERCLALGYQGLGNYYATLSESREPGPNREEAQQWYSKALSIWNRWRAHNIALPYSANREKDLLRLKAGLTSRN
ncbi:MAG TPA: protein kinase [Bryobacteraceae bacterium]|nr:protein kinase [Bryobacteraceae bacterium]